MNWPNHLELSYGTRVRTIKPENESKDWSKKAVTSRKWNVTGKIVDYSDSHGLIYAVKHYDYNFGWYERRELEII